tara:strand:+ start:243 stop:836 length:594 start_codon:yes stop_codon:yes gene_type:complete
MSELNVDTINEQTAANGVTIDGVLIKDGQVDGVDVSGITSGKILQVVQGEFTSTTSGINEIASPVDVGLSASITPSSASNKVLVLVNIGLIGWNLDTVWAIQLVRASTTIGTGAASSTRIPIHAGGGHTDHSTWQSTSVAGMYLDSPNTTSATTYKVQYGGNGTATLYINRNERDHTNSGDEDMRSISTITLMEVSA